MIPWEGGGGHPGGARISFSTEVKAELAGLIPARPCCQLNELLGIFFSTRGRVINTSNGQAAYFSQLRNAVARKVIRLGRNIAQTEAKYHAQRSAKRTSFFVELPLPPGLEVPFSYSAARVMPDRPCDRKALLRGLFLGCGSVNAPTARYHLEFVTPTLSWGTGVVQALGEFEIRAGLVERSGHNVVYIKDADDIVRTMSMMGGNRAVIDFENARVVREVSGHVNRRLNFETANLDKAIGSSMRQVAAIDRLEKARLLENLSPALQEMARWRREHPELNLAELASRMSLSKSAINHRLRRLVEIWHAVTTEGEPVSTRSA